MKPKKGKANKSKASADDRPSEVENMKMPSRKSRTSSSSSTSSTSPSPRDSSHLIRQQRNNAEKQRRDKLNSYITELAVLVPMVSRSTKKLDKTSILRLSAAHLRLHHSSLNPNNHKKVVSWRPSIFEAEHLNELLKAIDGFLLITTPSTKIIFTSKYVENYLGHQDIEMIGHSLYYFLHPGDHSEVRNELKKLSSICQKEKKRLTRITFCARFRERSQPRSELVNYHLMRFNCSYSIEEEDKIPSSHAKCILSARSKKQLDMAGGLLNFYVQPVNINPFDELSITEAFQEEYVTHHGPQGEILHADHRISTITGHLPHEVIGTLAYDYIFDQDIPVAKFAQRLMFTSSDGRGMIVYRLRTRDTSAVYLKTFGQLQYDKSTMKITHFLCVNKLLNEEEGNEELKKFKEKYSPKIREFLSFSTNQPQSLNTIQSLPMIESFSSQELSVKNVTPMEVSPYSLSIHSAHSITSADSITAEDCIEFQTNKEELDLAELQKSPIMTSLQCTDTFSIVNTSSFEKINKSSNLLPLPATMTSATTPILNNLNGNSSEMDVLTSQILSPRHERKRLVSNDSVECAEVKRIKYDGDELFNFVVENKCRKLELFHQAPPSLSSDPKCESQWSSYSSTPSDPSDNLQNGYHHQHNINWPELPNGIGLSNWSTPENSGWTNILPSGNHGNFKDDHS